MVFKNMLGRSFEGLGEPATLEAGTNPSEQNRRYGQNPSISGKEQRKEV